MALVLRLNGGKFEVDILRDVANERENLPNSIIDDGQSGKKVHEGSRNRLGFLLMSKKISVEFDVLYLPHR